VQQHQQQNQRDAPPLPDRIHRHEPAELLIDLKVPQRRSQQKIAQNTGGSQHR